MEMTTIEQIRGAQDKIRSRHGKAVCMIQEIESGHTQRFIDYALGKITAAELDDFAQELIHLREVAKEDTADALQYFYKLAQGISDRERLERQRQEVRAQRREWAIRYNEILSRTDGCSLPEIEALAHGRPSEVTGPMWHRLTMKRTEFASQPQTGQTFGNFASLELLDMDA